MTHHIDNLLQPLHHRKNGVAERKKFFDEEVYVAQPLGYVKGEKGEIRINQVMAEIFGNGDGFLPEVSNGQVVDFRATSMLISPSNSMSLMISGSFREGKSSSQRRTLVDAERTVQSVLGKTSMVDDLPNKNQELMKQIEICQEQDKILDKMHRQKVVEVEKLTQTMKEIINAKFRS